METLLLANSCLFNCISQIFVKSSRIDIFVLEFEENIKIELSVPGLYFFSDLILVELPGIFEYPSDSDHYEHEFQINDVFHRTFGMTFEILGTKQKHSDTLVQNSTLKHPRCCNVLCFETASWHHIFQDQSVKSFGHEQVSLPGNIQSNNPGKNQHQIAQGLAFSGCVRLQFEVWSCQRPRQRLNRQHL